MRGPELKGYETIFKWARENFLEDLDAMQEHYQIIRDGIEAAWAGVNPDVPGTWEGGSFVIRYIETLPPVAPLKKSGDSDVVAL